MASVALLRNRLSSFVRDRPRWMLAAAAVLAIVVLYPFVGGWLGARVVASKLQGRLGVPVRITGGRAGLAGFTFRGIVVGGQGDLAPVATIERALIPFSAAWGGGTVRLERPRLHLVRGGAHDNVTALLERRRGGGSAGGGGGARLPRLVLVEGSLTAEDRLAVATIGRIDAEVVPGASFDVTARRISGRVRLRGGESDPAFGAELVAAHGPLVGLRPTPFPTVRLEGGALSPLPTLPLTGITGTVEPAGQGVQVKLAGSYGGAKQTLWTADGSLAPGAQGQGPEGALSLRAERFALDKVAEVLPSSVLQPQDTSIDAALDLRFSRGRVEFTGNLDVAGLNLHHEKLALEPIFDLTFSLRADGAFVPERRRLELKRLEGQLRDLVGVISGSVELAPGAFVYKDGTQMSAIPRIDMQVRVPRVPCAKALASIPGPIVPKLRGFVLQGTLEADLHTRIDYQDLDAVELGGKVGIDGCRVLKAPDEVVGLGGPDSVVQAVEVPPRPGDLAQTDTLVFPIGPDNPDFVPYDKISPHIVNAIMTTEDSGFFKHRGWVSPEFKTALKRNLASGAFRFGASSITMQMVKNVLLAKEKTLSRKLQELFIVWYLEQQLPKERILELYFNAIEFGPRIYGIGAAARHYFGKSATDIGPLEAAFFSSILPSPKRRYVQYCAGQLSPKWDSYVRRILKKIYERGRLSEEEYKAAAAQPLVFDTRERPAPEKQCLEWVKRMTARPEPEPEAEADSQ